MCRDSPPTHVSLRMTEQKDVIDKLGHDGPQNTTVCLLSKFTMYDDVQYNLFSSSADTR